MISLKRASTVPSELRRAERFVQLAVYRTKAPGDRCDHRAQRGFFSRCVVPPRERIERDAKVLSTVPSVLKAEKGSQLFTLQPPNRIFPSGWAANVCTPPQNA
jgi:hypothetical protein